MASLRLRRSILRSLGWAPFLLFFGGCDPEAASTGAGDRDLLELGREVYRQNCLTCHQRNGSGVPGMHPSLRHGDWTQGDPARLIQVILYGSRGPVEGRNSRGEMPEFSYLSDQEVAALATYIRREFGKGGSPVEPDRVKRARK
jgi:mono/diheme cytochrome c family protein